MMHSTVEVIQCFVLVIEYLRGSGTLECIIYNQHKAMYNLLSPGPALSCAGDKSVAHSEYTPYGFTVLEYHEDRILQYSSHTFSEIFLRLAFYGLY